MTVLAIARARALADELHVLTTRNETADAPIKNHACIHAMRIHRIEREMTAQRQHEAEERRIHWLDKFAHGIYTMELRWTKLLARSATHRVGCAGTARSVSCD
jgi:hypothetical protein